MKRRALTSSILIVHALAATTSSCSSDSENVGGATSSENVAEAEQAVSNGTFATNDEYPYIGFITDPRCSAILITPGWVLTAAHCIDGGEAGSACGFSDPPTNTNGPLDSYIMHLFNDPIGGPTPIPQQFVHTQPISGVVHTILKRAIDSCSDEDAALDLALVRLDKRVPLWLVAPKHPPNGHCSPQLEINGTIIGYGPTFGLADDNGADVPQRNYTTSAGWTLTSVSTGNIYQNFWQFPLAPPWVPGQPEPWYDGPLKGDSGGALIDADTGNLCGVVSRFYPTGVNPFASDIDDGEWDRSSGQISVSFS